MRNPEDPPSERDAQERKIAALNQYARNNIQENWKIHCETEPPHRPRTSTAQEKRKFGNDKLVSLNITSRSVTAYLVMPGLLSGDPVINESWFSHFNLIIREVSSI